jgi:hypothetical protein
VDAHFQPIGLGEALTCHIGRLDAVLNHAHAPIIDEFLTTIDLCSGNTIIAHRLNPYGLFGSIQSPPTLK